MKNTHSLAKFNYLDHASLAPIPGWLRTALIALLLVTPWVVAPQVAPSPTVLPWLFSLACVALLLPLLRPSLPPKWVSIGGVALLTAALSSLSRQDFQLLALASAMVMMVICAALAARPGAEPAMPGLIATTWLLAALVSSVIGLCQYIGVEQHFPFMSVSAAGEAFANLRQRNQFATLTSIGLISLIWRAPQSATSLWSRWGLPFAAVLLALGNAASSSRTGLIQIILIAAMSAYWGLWRATLSRQLLSVAAVTYMVAAFILPEIAGQDVGTSGILSRFRSTSVDCASRLTLWRDVMHLIAIKPWQGWGWGELDYAHFVTLFEDHRHCELIDNAHNLILQLAVELGLPVAVLVATGMVWIVIEKRPWAERDRARQIGWAVLAVVLLHSQLEYPLWYGPFQMALGLSLGLVLPASGAGEAKAGTDEVPQRSAWSNLITLGILMAVVYAAWDYHRISQIYLPPKQRASAYREHTLEKIRGSWLFQEQVRFAEYSITPLTRENAQQLYDIGLELLHYSPEPRVVEKLLESAMLLGREDDVRFYLARFRAAYPKEHAQWMARRAGSLPPPE